MSKWVSKYDALCLFFSMQGFLSHFAEVMEGSLADKYDFCKQIYIIKIPPVLVLAKI